MKRRDFAMGVGAAIAAGPLLAPAAARADIAWTAAPGRDVSVWDKAWARAASGADPALGQTDALVIVQDGTLVYERYGADSGPGVRHISWSMAKSITHALVGIAVGDGLIDIDAPLKLRHAGDPSLTMRHLLTLTDGLAWDEGDYDPAKSDATRMLYGEGRFDGAAYVAAKPQAYPPGTHWRYSTGSFHFAAAELQAHLFPTAVTPEARRRTMADWIQRRLFDPLGMTSAIAEFDAAGTFVGGSLVYATARDFARFGEMYRNNGGWDGKQVIPPGWQVFGRRPSQMQPAYGAGWWLETKPGNGEPSLMRGEGPMETFSAQGHNGQVIAVVLSKRAVVVRLGLMDDGEAAWTALSGWLAPVVNAL